MNRSMHGRLAQLTLGLAISLSHAQAAPHKAPRPHAEQAHLASPKAADKPNDAGVRDARPPLTPQSPSAEARLLDVYRLIDVCP